MQADKAYALAWRQELVNRRRALGTPKFSGPEADRWWWYRGQEDQSAREIYRLEQQEQSFQESLDHIESRIRALGGR